MSPDDSERCRIGWVFEPDSVMCLPSVPSGGACALIVTARAVLRHDALELIGRIFLPCKDKPPPLWRRGFEGKDPGDDLLLHAHAHYHRRSCVSLPSSGWDRVVPQRYVHQGEGGGSRFWAITVASDSLAKIALTLSWGWDVTRFD